ncbi:hypothetical protein [Phenylobacterium sp.]|jgi:hypothetical protein|uniref:hypothetical protein n=1 Tax=Phenylobacterium sp. TaxID=1871053 RepID=UPI002F91F8BD
MYRLRVIHPGAAFPTETVSLERAADVLTAIPELLARHADCDRVEVMANDSKLFAVDCKGNRLDG